MQTYHRGTQDLADDVSGAGASRFDVRSATFDDVKWHPHDPHPAPLLLEPLSTEWKKAPAAQEPDNTWSPVGGAALTTMAFWSAAAFGLAHPTLFDHDLGILDRLAEIGVIPGIRDHESCGRRQGRQPIGRSRVGAGRDHFGRALAAVRGISAASLS